MACVKLPKSKLLKAQISMYSFIQTGLHFSFCDQLFGQPYVHRQVESILGGYLRDENPQNPLVLSFHGQTGTGKNHVARLIAESMYRKGMHSQYVHLKLPMRDYPHKNQLSRYKVSSMHWTVYEKVREIQYVGRIFISRLSRGGRKSLIQFSNTRWQHPLTMCPLTAYV